MLSVMAIGLSGCGARIGGVKAESLDSPPPVASPEWLSATQILEAGDSDIVTATTPELSSSLNDLYLTSLSSQDIITAANRLHIQIRDGAVPVTITLIEGTNPEAVSVALVELGGEVTSSFGSLMDAWLPVESLGLAAELPGIGFIQEQIQTFPMTNEGE